MFFEEKTREQRTNSSYHMHVENKCYAKQNEEDKRRNEAFSGQPHRWLAPKHDSSVYPDVKCDTSNKLIARIRLRSNHQFRRKIILDDLHLRLIRYTEPALFGVNKKPVNILGNLKSTLKPQSTTLPIKQSSNQSSSKRVFQSRHNTGTRCAVSNLFFDRSEKQKSDT